MESFLARLPTRLPLGEGAVTWSSPSSTSSIYISTMSSTKTDFASVIVTEQRLVASRFCKPFPLAMPIPDVDGQSRLFNGDRITPSELRETRFRRSMPPLAMPIIESPLQTSHVSGLRLPRKTVPLGTRPERGAKDRTHATTSRLLKTEAFHFMNTLDRMRSFSSEETTIRDHYQAAVRLQRAARIRTRAMTARQLTVKRHEQKQLQQQQVRQQMLEILKIDPRTNSWILSSADDRNE